MASSPLAPHNHPFEKLIKALVMKPDAESLSFTAADCVVMLDRVKGVLSEESPLVELAPPLVVVGDLRGSLRALKLAYDQFMDDEGTPAHHAERFVFLGNYVGGGKNSLHVLMMLFAMKVQCPDTVVLLRGNQELRAVNEANGFKAELEKRYGETDAADLFERFNEVFDHMPLACLLGGKILCVHGGISPALSSLDDIRNIPKPLKNPSEHQLACDLLWADPMIHLKGFIPNEARGSVFFGADALDATLKRLDLSQILRGNEIIYKGLHDFDKYRFLTITTTPDRQNGNYGAFIKVHGINQFHGYFTVPPARYETEEEGHDDEDFCKYEDCPNHAVYRKSLSARTTQITQIESQCTSESATQEETESTQLVDN